MSRATSAGVYGPSWIDPARTPMVAARRAYGLRTASHPDGWAPAYVSRPRRKRREVVDPSTGLLAPLAPVDDDAPVRRYVRSDHAPTGPDYAAERRLIQPIVMADF
jgi:hypothetical protein